MVIVVEPALVSPPTVKVPVPGDPDVKVRVALWFVAILAPLSE
jgi:hypothetical protein